MQMLLIKTYRFIRTLDRNGWKGAGSGAPVLSPDEARQGVITGRVAAVLTVSLALAVFAGAMLVALHMFPI
jgi:hypothetical protein